MKIQISELCIMTVDKIFNILSDTKCAGREIIIQIYGEDQVKGFMGKFISRGWTPVRENPIESV